MVDLMDALTSACEIAHRKVDVDHAIGEALSNVRCGSRVDARETQLRRSTLIVIALIADDGC